MTLDAEGLTPLQRARRRQLILEESRNDQGLLEGGKALVALLEGVEAAGSYQAHQAKCKLPSYFRRADLPKTNRGDAAAVRRA